MKQIKHTSLLCWVLAIALIVGCFPFSASAAEEELPFTDVPKEAWYYEAVSYVYEQGLMEGVSKDSFLPLGVTTRAMVITVLFRAEHEPEDRGLGFTDVPSGCWYSDAVLWAQAAGIAEGYGDGTFLPDRPMSRQEMVTVFFRYAKYKGLPLDKGTDLGAFLDEANIADYAEEALRWAVSVGLIKGVSQDQLLPEGTSDRAQLAAVLSRLHLLMTLLEQAPFVPEHIAELYGIDPYDYDSDADGLDNYTEIYVTSTDPLLPDSDEDGIEDAWEDADGDGLDNGTELSLGTDPAKTDSDSDGLGDAEEVKTSLTSPALYDTDADGLCDGDELLLGTDPLNPVSDGVTPDGQRRFTQTLQMQNIDTRLRGEENAVIPALTTTARGNINRSISMDLTASNRFSDSRAIVGRAFDLKGSEIDNGQLSFRLRYNDVSYIAHEEGSFPSLLICRYNADGTTDYLPTSFSDGVLSADIDREGTYFVMDVKKLFDELGLVLPVVSDPGAEVSAADRYTRSVEKVMAQADIVFLIDTTSSMRNEIDHVKENVGHFVEALKDEGISASMALIDYQDLEYDGYDTTRVHKNGSFNWFADMDAYAEAISALELGIGGDHPECALDALETARLLDMRASAGKIFVLVTDARYKTDNRYGIPSMEAEIQLLENEGVRCCVITPDALKGNYTDLYTRTGGIWLDIYGDFYVELMSLAQQLGSDIVGDGYWIYLDGPIPVPVRLDAEPYAGSTVDTDGDGIYDVEELADYGPTGYIDLDALLTQVSQGVITDTQYGQVMMYQYVSNPVLTDTDYDGISDKQDVAPDNNHFSGVMYYSGGSNTCNVEFTVDYRLFFGDNTAYTKELSVLGSLYASDIYQDLYIDVTKGTSGGSENAVDFPKLFGLQDVEDIHLKASEYQVDKDDLSEFVVGHRTVLYGGETREILVLSVRGTNGTNAEWSSNFDVGANTSSYYAAMGSSHPDWKNKANHKGFDVTTNRIITKFTDYIQRHGLDDISIPKTIFVVGHSRGAAIANLLGAYFEDHPDYTSFTYTFAAPYCTTDSKAASYETIFNVTNYDDLIPYLPLPDWGFKKYGTVLTISVADYYEDSNMFGDAEGSFEWLTGLDYNDNGGISSALNAFAAIVDTREQLYVLDNSSDGQVNIGNAYHTTQAGAEERLLEVQALMDEAKLSRFCQLSIVSGTFGIKHVRVTYSPAYLMQNLANMASGVGPLTGYDTAGKYATAKSAFATCYIGGMTHPHMQPTYYLIAYNDFKELS